MQHLSVDTCPECGLPLQLAMGLPRIDDPDAILQEEDTFIDDSAPRDMEFVAGDLALHKKDLLLAETHFRTTLDLDDLRQTEARQLLGITLIWQGRLAEAIEELDLDAEERGVKLSSFFALWCILCRHEDRQTFMNNNITPFC